MPSSFGAWEKMPWDQLISMYKTQQAWEKEIKKGDMLTKSEHIRHDEITSDTQNNNIAICKHESMIRHIFVNY